MKALSQPTKHAGVRMHITHRITTTAAIMLSLAAVGAPTATAMVSRTIPATANQAPATAYSRPDKSMIAAASPSSPAILVKASVPQAAVRIQTTESGFEWGDAGIGAASVLALTMLVLGGGLVISQRRRRHGAA
jgi:hypothetical protein